MSKPSRLASLLLFSSALVAPSAVFAQTSPGSPGTDVGQSDAAPAASAGQTSPIQSTPATPAADAQTPPDVSVPGGNAEIVVTGRRNGNQQRTTAQVVSVLSSADIARTGEGNIAGALSRVTGLSVVGNGFVFVRGLGDRYSLALLNGSPLPSPEPLRRVVPLDLFPTSVIASSLVQKTYSPNFPGEFGGGVINLTTISSPRESFLTVGGSVGADSYSTGRMGYTYYGSGSDWTGFDNGTRNYQPALNSFLKSGKRITDLTLPQQEAVATNLVTANNSLLQRNDYIPANFAGSVTGGTSFDLDWATLGVIATAGYSSKWQTRETLQQAPASNDLSQLNFNTDRVITDNHVVVNGLLGFGLDFDANNKVRWTNLYIRDTLKQARLGVGTRDQSFPGATLQTTNTAWYERQLIDTQLVGDFKFGDLTVSARSGYANSQREAPYETTFTYIKTNRAGDPFGGYYVNKLDRNRGVGEIAFSDLNEDLWSGGLDLSYRFIPELTLTAGYAFTDQTRDSARRDFYFNPTSLPDGVTLLRPDYLLQPASIGAFGIGLIETTESAPAFRAHLRTDAGYVQLQASLMADLDLNAGVRYERGNQVVNPLQVFSVLTNSGAVTNIRRDYWLPAATLTYRLKPGMQVRLNASKTIARPQFRELLIQTYYDPEANRTYTGNPLLQDSQLYNAEARFEWYFAPEQRVTLAGFFKKIDHPIEVYQAQPGENGASYSFANAPRANLYGAEVEAQKFFDIAHDGFFASRRAVLIANYTFTKSKIKVDADDQTLIYGVAPLAASQVFRDGAPLTGQSDHIANLEFGLEERGHLSQQTFLLSYASKRVTSRGQSFAQPDVFEYPGFHLDFVARQNVKLATVPLDLKLEVRNITYTKYKEYQTAGANRVYYNLYNVGTSATFGASITF